MVEVSYVNYDDVSEDEYAKMLYRAWHDEEDNGMQAQTRLAKIIGETAFARAEEICEGQPPEVVAGALLEGLALALGAAMAATIKDSPESDNTCDRVLARPIRAGRTVARCLLNERKNAN